MENLEICRICTSYVNATNATDLFGRSQRNLLLQIRDLTAQTLKNEKDLPRFICPACEENLQRAYSFRKRTIESQMYFYSTKYLSHIKRKSFDSAKRFDTENKDVKPNDIDEQSVEVIIKEEVNTTDTNENDVLDCMYNLQKSEELYTSLHSEFHYPSDKSRPSSNDNEEKVQNKAPITVENTTNNANKKSKNSKKSKTVKSKSASHRPITSLRTTKGNQKVDLICDQCGNHFNCRHHFLTHLRRHTNDKPFKCEVCPDKFYTHSELKRHMRRHTGEKPFACKYCQRKFTDYSTRIKHERMHTNERPFPCLQCGKAFTTTYVLKNHMLVHTGERSFKCIPCNKAFQRQTHLTVHYRSLMHKQMLERQESKQEFPLSPEAEFVTCST